MRQIVPQVNMTIGRRGDVVSVADDLAAVLVEEGKASYADEATFDPLLEMTVAELRGRASKLDIAGRSSMDKDQLIEAINEHQDER